jgi:hypothetical protein
MTSLYHTSVPPAPHLNALTTIQILNQHTDANHNETNPVTTKDYSIPPNKQPKYQLTHPNANQPNVEARYANSALECDVHDRARMGGPHRRSWLQI